MRVAHVVSHPIQYFAPLYRELATRPEIDLTVFFCSDATAGAYHDDRFGLEIRWDTPLLEGYRYVLAEGSRRAPAGSTLRFRPRWDVAGAVRRGRFDAVWAHGYSYATTWLAAVAAHASGARFLLREEATLLPRRTLARRVAKEVPLRLLLRGAIGLYIGEENRRFLRRYGVPESRLFPARYCVDVTALRRREQALRPRRSELRAALGVAGDDPVVLYVGKLYDVKQPLRLVEAAARVRRRRACRLLVVGDGVERPRAERLAGALGLDDAVFAGFLNQSELPRAYVAADMLVLPSRAETWGLVVNEALAFGLPVVVTDKVGCATDLVRDGWNGRVVRHDSTDELAAALEELVADPELRDRWGRRGRRRSDDYTVEACADQIVSACLATARGGVA